MPALHLLIGPVGAVARRTLASGADVWLEIGLLGRQEREAFYEQARVEDLERSRWDIVDA